MGKKKSRKLIKKLRMEIAALEDKNMEMLHTISSLNADMRMKEEQVMNMRELIDQDAARECGCVTLSSDSNYKGFIETLNNNGYAVEVEKIEKKQMVKLSIREGEVG